MKISVLGTGYVGLVTAACFAELGNEVVAADIDESKIARLKNGEIPIYEPGLEEVVKRNFKEERLDFTTDLKKAIKHGDVIFIAVGTPNGHNGSPDLSYIESAAKAIGENLDRPRQVVAMKSTVPVGTFKKIREIISAGKGKDLEFAVVSNPEFLKEGDAVQDFMRPDRIVVGAEEDWARGIMSELYAAFTKNNHPIFMMDPASAEMSKYAANTFLAARISLMNEMAAICEAVGADVEEVRRAIAADERIGKHFLYAGVGYGGSCFPKDVTALAATAKAAGYPANMVMGIEEVNATQRERFAKKILDELGDVKGKKIAVWGLSFKPKTDDMRQAPSVTIIQKLLSEGAQISAYDPEARKTAEVVFGDKIEYGEDMYEILKDASALVLLTEWAQFREPDFDRVKTLVKDKIIFDGRNIYDPPRMSELGFRYFGIGRISRNS